MDRLKAMETFVRIVKTSSLSRAADELGISRALVSKHLQLLEKYLGARLLNRTTRQIFLTEIGADYYAFCTKILASFEEEEATISQLQREPRGTLKIIAPSSFGNLHIASIVSDFMTTYQEIKISLILADTFFTPIDLVERGYDLAIWLREVDNLSIIATKVGEVRWVVCASPGYLSKNGRPKRPADLHLHNCLVHRSISSNGIWHLEGPNEKCDIHVSGHLVANSVIALRVAVLADLGIALLPTYCIGTDLRVGRLVNVFPKYSVPDRPIFVLYPHSLYLQHKVRVFLDFLKDRLRQKPWDRV